MSDICDDHLLLPPREPAAPQNDENESPDRLSFIFRTRTLAELLSAFKYNKVLWWPSDKILIMSFLAFYRLGPSDIKGLKGALSTKTIRCRVDAAGPRQRPGEDPDLHQLAAWMNVDLPSLSSNEWAAISGKVISSLEYTISKVAKEHCLVTYWDADLGAYRLRWPDDLRRTWLHPHWKGDMGSHPPPPPPPPQPREAPTQQDRGREPNGDDAAGRDQPQIAANTGTARGPAPLLTPPLTPLSTWPQHQVNLGLVQPTPQHRPLVLLTPPARGPASHQARSPCSGIFPLTPPGSKRASRDENDDNGHGPRRDTVVYGTPSRPSSRPGNGLPLPPFPLPPRLIHPLSQRAAQGSLTPSRPRRLAMTGPVGGGALTVAVEAVNDVMLRYNIATQELVNISINEMTARWNLHNVLFQHSTSGRGAPQRALTPKERADSARALVVSLAADTDDSEAASRLPMPDEGDFGPLRRLVKLHARRHQVVTEMRRLAVLVRLGLQKSSLAGDGVNAEAWRHLINGTWEPDVLWLGVM